MVKELKEEELKKLFKEFQKHINKNFSIDFVNFVEKRRIKELIWLQVKCKEFSNKTNDGVKDPERIISILNSEINHRMYKQTRFISIIAILISLISAIVAISALIKNN